MLGKPENFLIPIAGLNRCDHGSWLKLGELWSVALVLNILGWLLIAIIAAESHSRGPCGPPR